MRSDVVELKQLGFHDSGVRDAIDVVRVRIKAYSLNREAFDLEFVVFGNAEPLVVVHHQSHDFAGLGVVDFPEFDPFVVLSLARDHPAVCLRLGAFRRGADRGNVALKVIRVGVQVTLLEYVNRFEDTEGYPGQV